MIVGIGVDLVASGRVRRMLERWRERFLRRVFTPDEVGYALGRRDPAEHLAARFAAKEATLKALGTGLTMGVRWREMEVRRARGARPVLALSGRVRALADARGVRALHLSLTHDGDYALAQVIAESEVGPPGEVARP